MLRSLEEFSPTWLEKTLDVRLSHFTLRPNPAFNSTVAHLELDYASQTALPRRLLLKLNREFDGQNEVRFHRLASPMSLPMLPRCFAAHCDEATGHSFLLLEDISETHLPPVDRAQLLALQGVPSVSHLDAVMDVLADFHAAFWQHPCFNTIPDLTQVRWWYRDAESHASHVLRRTGEWTKFRESFGKRVPPEWLELGEAALASLPRLFKKYIQPRLESLRSLTISHGDCYLTQFLVPRAGTRSAYLVDFQDASVNFPAFDLVYLFCTFWTQPQRALHEHRLLHRYLDGLDRLGVDYSWENLSADYRLCIAYMLFDPVWNAVSGSSPDYWFPKLSSLVDAYLDWECSGL